MGYCPYIRSDKPLNWLDEGRSFPSDGCMGNDPVVPPFPAPLEHGTVGYSQLLPGVSFARVAAIEVRLRVAAAALHQIAKCSKLCRELGAGEPYSERIARHALALLGTLPLKK